MVILRSIVLLWIFLNQQLTCPLKRRQRRRLLLLRSKSWRWQEPRQSWKATRGVTTRSLIRLPEGLHLTMHHIGVCWISQQQTIMVTGETQWLDWVETLRSLNAEISALCRTREGIGRIGVVLPRKPSNLACSLRGALNLIFNDNLMRHLWQFQRWEQNLIDSKESIQTGAGQHGAMLLTPWVKSTVFTGKTSTKSKNCIFGAWQPILTLFESRKSVVDNLNYKKGIYEWIESNSADAFCQHSPLLGTDFRDQLRS